MARQQAQRPSVKRRAAQSGRGKAPVVAAVALAGALAVGGTLAWLTDGTAEVANTFEPAEVTCAVVESGEIEGSEFIDGVSAKKTDVEVQNTGDVSAYVRVAVVANWVDAEGNVAPVAPVAGTDYDIVLNTADADGWTARDGFYYYEAAVAPSSATDPLIASCSPKAAKGGYALQIDILCSAIQAEGVDAKGNRPVELAWGVDIENGQVKPATIVE